MFSIEATNYTPALRLKKGEAAALSELDAEVKDRVLPHLIISPLSEKEIELNRKLRHTDFAPTQVERIWSSWGPRPFFLDLRLVHFADDAASDADQFYRFLTAATRKGCSPIPVFDLSTNEDRLTAVARNVSMILRQPSV